MKEICLFWNFVASGKFLMPLQNILWLYTGSIYLKQEPLITLTIVNYSCDLVGSLNHLIESNIEIGMEVILSKGK